MVTVHFKQRLKNRVGLKKTLSKSYFDKAVENGLYLEDFECRPTFYNYLIRILRNNCICIVYNRHIIVCSRDYDGITILDLPKEFYSTVESVKKEKRDEDVKRAN